MPEKPAGNFDQASDEFPQSVPSQWRAGFMPLRSDRWTGWIARSYWRRGIEQELDDVDRLFSDGSVVTWYKQHRNRLAEIRWPGETENPQMNVVLKAYGTRTLPDRVRAVIRPSRARRHWNTAWTLLQRNINTPMPVLLAMPANNRSGLSMIAVEPAVPHLRARALLHRMLEGETRLQVGESWLSPQQVATGCGRYVRELHDSGLLHRDLSGGNLLIPLSWNGSCDDLTEKFILIDINRVRLRSAQRISVNQRMQDLERLTFPESLLETYYLAYAGNEAGLVSELDRFLKYRRAYRRIREENNPFKRASLKVFTYWTRTG